MDLLQPELYATLLFIALMLVSIIFYFATLQKALKSISRENRKMVPVNVWLLCVPIFNFVWIFIVVNAIAVSFKLEYEKYGVYNDNKPTYTIGLAMAISQLFSGIFGLVGLIALLCWIAHWIKVNQCIKEFALLKQNNTLADGEKSIFL